MSRESLPGYVEPDAPDEMVIGYMDGLNPDSPEPSDNRSACYRHGFANGRDDLRHEARATAQMLRVLSKAAQREDANR